MKRKFTIFTIGLMILGFWLFPFESAKAQSRLSDFLSKENSGVKKVPQMVLDSKALGAVFQSRELFRPNAELIKNDNVLSRAVSEGVILNLDKMAIGVILNDSPQYMLLPVPDGKGGVIELELIKVNIFAQGFKVTTSAPTGENYEKALGVHYRGMIKGEPLSLAAVSIFENEIMGSIFSKTRGDRVLGRMGGNNPSDRHIFYADKNLKTRLGNFCTVTSSGNQSVSIPTSREQPDSPDASAVVRQYVEIDYTVFQQMGSVNASVEYVTGFFNQSATLFGNDGIYVSLQETFVWSTPSPYLGIGDNDLQRAGYDKGKFQETRTTYNGDMAHLVTFRYIAGIAGLNALCNREASYAVSGVLPFYEDVPTFSFTVEVFTHESGHILGSPHTHSCEWGAGNNLAIDGCVTPAGCANPGLPGLGGGTIMSYCHQQPTVGIGFGNGFGPLPKARILGRIAAATCLVDNRRAPFDFDGDNKTDIGIFRPTGAQGAEWWINRSSNNTTFAATFGSSDDKFVPADYTGDGKTDVAVFRLSNGNWFVLRSEDFTFYAFPFGTGTDVPVPADFDGDNKADAAVFRSSTATWYINKSTGGTDIIGFGGAGDIPVVGDYDGDNKADIAIYRPNGGSSEWWVRRSFNTTVFALAFGSATDKPVQGDYTGDGKTDVAFWRPATGDWFVLRSEDSSFYAAPFGASGDVPVPGDYDGDGKFDFAVWRPSQGNWYLQRSTAGSIARQFGLSTDKPVPSAFVP